MQKATNPTGSTTARVIDAAAAPPVATGNGGGVPAAVANTINAVAAAAANVNAANGGVPACAACRHQRKKCTDKCILAPFFPAEKNQEFQAVHKVFGVSNVTKLVKDFNVEEGKMAADSLIWEANCRIKDPVLGAYGEYQRVCEEVKYYKAQCQALLHQNRQVAQVPLTQSHGVLYRNDNKPGQQRLLGPWNGHNNGGGHGNGTHGGINSNGGHGNGTRSTGMNVINHHNGSDYIHHHGINGGGVNVVDASSIYDYELVQNMEKLNQERDQNGAQILSPQLMDGYKDGYNY